MSSNRLKYDVCSYKAELKQSIKPINYMLDPIKYNNCNRCIPNVGIVGGLAVSNIKGNLVDLESDLMGRTHVATRCPQYMYEPTKTNEIVSKEYTKLNKHAPINIELNNLNSCEIVNPNIAQAKEPPLDRYICK
jgi:hypothetical protein